MQQNEILRSYGTDYKNMTRELLRAADAAVDIRARCAAAVIDAEAKTDAKSEILSHSGAAYITHEEAAESKINLESGRALHIGIKPNLVCPTPAEMGGTTHPEIVAGIIEYLLEEGFRADELEILEGSWVGDKTSEAYEYCGYNAVSQEYGVRLIDMQQERESEARDCAGLSLDICTRALNLDYLINVPVLKGHCQTRITCALKNMKGLIPNSEKRRFHRLGLHEPIAKLNTVLKPDLIVIDHICGDPDFEEGGNPLVRNCVMLAKDPVLVDTFTAKVLGYEPEDVEYISLAESLGVGSTDLSGAVIRTISGNITDGEPADDWFKLPLETVEGADEHKGDMCCGTGDDDMHSDVSQGGAAFTGKENGADGESKRLAQGIKLPDTRRVVETAYAVSEIDSCSACYGSLIPALDRLKAEGLFDRLLERLDGERLAIGQGYRGCDGHYGVGNCTAGFTHCIKGCPPESEYIYKELKTML